MKDFFETVTFDDFWSLWPDKRNKLSASKAFAKLTPEDRQRATSRVSEWCRDWRKSNPDASHIHAAPYLNARRFLDVDETKAEVTADGIFDLQADWVKQGKTFLCRTLSPSRIDDLIAMGKVTHEEARRAGVL